MEFSKNAKDTELPKECVVPLLDTRFVRVYDLQYAEGKHYYDASRKTADRLTAVQPEEAFEKSVPDGVTCFIVIRTPGEEDRLLMSYEYRYPTGRYLLSPPAGLVDPEDCGSDDPLITAAKREIHEETGIEVKETDRIEVLNRLVFSSPGLTDESNGLVLAVINLPDLSCLTQKNAVGSEKFDGFELLTRSAAKKILQDGTDRYGHFYSLQAWAALMTFTGCPESE